MSCITILLITGHFLLKEIEAWTMYLLPLNAGLRVDIIGMVRIFNENIDIIGHIIARNRSMFNCQNTTRMTHFWRKQLSLQTLCISMIIRKIRRACRGIWVILDLLRSIRNLWVCSKLRNPKSQSKLHRLWRNRKHLCLWNQRKLLCLRSPKNKWLQR